MEYLNLASDKLLDKWRHNIFQEVQKPILANMGKHHVTVYFNFGIAFY